MAHRTKTAPSSEETPAGEQPEAQAATAVQQDPGSQQSPVADAEQKRDEYLGLLQRTRADFENYQKRIQRDLLEEQRYAHGGFARELLPILDNLQRALEAARKQGDTGPLVQGVALVQSHMLDILGRFGITPVNALDQPFDPNVHDGVLQQPRTDVTPGTVVEVLEPGYRLHERVLRPARVVVAAPPAS